MEQREFIQTIKTFQRRLNMAGYLKKMVLTLRIGVVIGILIQAVALVMPLYYADIYAGIVLLLTVITTSVMAYVERTGMEQTALVMDSFGFDERIVTAYGNLEKEGALVALQRADAMRQLQAHQDKIQIPLLPSWKKIVSLIGLSMVMIGLSLVPSAVKEYAEELHSVREEAQEKTDEIEEVVEVLKQLEQEEALTPEQQAQLQEMIESLQASQEEYQQATSNEMMKAASEKLEYRYENMGSQLASLAQSMKNGASVSSVTEESLQALSEKLQEMSSAQLAMQNASSQNGSSNGNSQNGSGQDGQQGSQSSNNQSGNQGNQTGNGQNGNGQADGAGSQNGNNPNGQSGGQDGNGQSGSGDGESGSGRGTGSSSTPHDYVSIPNDIADSGNLTGNAIDHDASEYFHAQNGLSWEGTHMSHEAVIGSYEQNAYEGIAQGKYPSGMEEIIKEYFSSFN